MDGGQHRNPLDHGAPDPEGWPVRLPEGVKIEVKVDLAALIFAVGALVKLFM